MEKNKTKITIEASVKQPIDKVWQLWNTPEHVTKWNNASEDWYTPVAENDLREQGKFNYKMAAKDGSFEFDFWGVYDEVRPNECIVYTLGDGRKVEISFRAGTDETHIIETFEAEDTNPVEMQQGGWQAILNNFKKYAEEN